MLGLERLVFRKYRESIENGINELENHGDSVHRVSEDLESNEMKDRANMGISWLQYWFEDLSCMDSHQQ